MISWYHFDEGLLPSAARQPWTTEGAPAEALAAKGYQLTTAAALGYHWQPVNEEDTRSSDPRTGDRIELQIAMQGKSATPAWGISPLVIMIDDGTRVLGVSIGPQLRWVDPYTGTDLGAITGAFSWLRYHDYQLVKDHTNTFALYVDGRKVGEVPYLHAPERASGVLRPAYVSWGCWDPGATSVSLWRSVESSLNAALPPQWKVDRVRFTAPPAVKAKWNARWRALARMLVGVSQEVINAMDSAWDLITAHRRALESFSFAGDQLPDDSGWTLSAPANFSVVRERVRMVASSAPVVALVGFGLARLPAEYRAAATFTVNFFASSDPDGRIGPMLEVRNGHRSIRAELVQVATDQIGWVLTEGTDAGPITIVGSKVWLIEEVEPHRVEVQVLGRSMVLLLVDGARVDEVPYSEFTMAVATRAARIGTNGQPASISAIVDMEHGLAEVRYSDLAHREIFLQTVGERLVFAGGCERNDHLDTLMRSHYELQGLRGTLQDMLLEVRRLSCSSDSTVVEERVEAGWYLDHNWPELTPIFLDAKGQLTDVFVELHHRSPNFLLADLVKLIATYLVPMSVMELEYFVCVATLLTAPTVNAATTTFTVSQPTHFDVGDAITMRDLANTTQEDAQIIAINQSSGAVETTALTNLFASGSTMRRTIQRT